MCFCRALDLSHAGPGQGDAPRGEEELVGHYLGQSQGRTDVAGPSQRRQGCESSVTSFQSTTLF